MEDRSPFTHILVPTDGSEPSISAGRLAIRIATTHNALITFVYVIDTIIAERMANATKSTIETVYDELENKGQSYLDYLTRLAHNRGLEANQVILQACPTQRSPTWHENVGST